MRAVSRSLIFLPLVFGSTAAFQEALLAQFSSPDPKRQERILFGFPVSVQPGYAYQIPFTVYSYYHNARIAGNVTARGGSGNDIEVKIVKDGSVIYSSGRRRSVVLSVPCEKAGRYTLILDNGFSMLSKKLVQGKISLVHWGEDVERSQQEKEASKRRLELARKIVGVLHSTLRSNEHRWGTSQLRSTPTVRLVQGDAPNAYAAWWNNTISVTPGLLELAESEPQQEEDILAGVLAHELSHIFYRHYKGSKAQSLWDEILGKSSLDRIQEKEADVLGVRIACEAGYDPTGFVTYFEKSPGRSSSFMSTHPSRRQRLDYLRAEAASCMVNTYTRRRPTKQADEYASGDFRTDFRTVALTPFQGKKDEQTLDAGVRAARALLDRGSRDSLPLPISLHTPPSDSGRKPRDKHSFRPTKLWAGWPCSASRTWKPKKSSPPCSS